MFKPTKYNFSIGQLIRSAGVRNVSNTVTLRTREVSVLDRLLYCMIFDVHIIDANMHMMNALVEDLKLIGVCVRSPE